MCKARSAKQNVQSQICKAKYAKPNVQSQNSKLIYKIIKIFKFSIIYIHNIYIPINIFLNKLLQMDIQRKELSEFQRGEIIGAWKCDLSVRKISELLDHPKSTVHEVIIAYKDGFETLPSRSGRPPIITERDGRHLMQTLNKDRKTNINELCEDFVTSSSTEVSQITLKRYLHKNKIYGRIGAKNLL